MGWSLISFGGFPTTSPWMIWTQTLPSSAPSVILFIVPIIILFAAGMMPNLTPSSFANSLSRSWMNPAPDELGFRQSIMSPSFGSCVLRCPRAFMIITPWKKLTKALWLPSR